MVGHLHHRRLHNHMLRSAAATVLAVFLILVCSTPVLADPSPPGSEVPAETTPPPPPVNWASCPDGVCGVGATSPGSPGTQATQQTAVSSGGTTLTGHRGNGEVDSAADPCQWVALPVQPVAGSVLWEGNDPSSGSVEYGDCVDSAGVMTSLGFRYVAKQRPVRPQSYRLHQLQKSWHNRPISNSRSHCRR